MYVALAVASVQGKSRVTVTEGQSRNYAVAEGGTLVSNKIIIKNEILAALKMLRELCPCPTKQIYFSYIELFMILSHKTQTMHF